MMETLSIKGGNLLRGEVSIGGAKNSLVALIPASIITKSIVKIKNVKPIDDTYTLIKILKGAYSVIKTDVTINDAKTEIELKLEIDTEISPVVSYFEIFLKRMIMCRKAAQKLGLDFKLVVNNQQLM